MPSSPVAASLDVAGNEEHAEHGHGAETVVNGHVPTMDGDVPEEESMITDEDGVVNLVEDTKKRKASALEMDVELPPDTAGSVDTELTEEEDDDMGMHAAIKEAQAQAQAQAQVQAQEQVETVTNVEVVAVEADAAVSAEPDVAIAVEENAVEAAPAPVPASASASVPPPTAEATAVLETPAQVPVSTQLQALPGQALDQVPTTTLVLPGTTPNPGTTVGTAPAADPRGVQLFDSKRMSRVSFNSWFEFDTYFEMYMQETFQPFRMRSSCSVDAYRRNQQKVMQNNKNSRGRRVEFPDSAIHHHRIYMCTHAMKARCRGNNARPGQKYRGIGCIAKINVKISPSDNANKYMVIVTDQVVTHNHPISKDIYERYPDVLLKNMRRNQYTASLMTRTPTAPKFEDPSQAQKYERAMGVLNSVAEVMARMPEEEYETQIAQLQKFYASIVTDNAQV